MRVMGISSTGAVVDLNRVNLLQPAEQSRRNKPTVAGEVIASCRVLHYGPTSAVSSGGADSGYDEL